MVWKALVQPAIQPISYLGATAWPYCLTGDVSEAMALMPMRSLTNKASRPFMRGIATGLVVKDGEVEFDHPEPGRSTKYKTLKSGAFALLYFGDRTSKFLDLAVVWNTVLDPTATRS